MAKWRVEDETEINERWKLTDGRVSVRCYEKSDAEWMCDYLNEREKGDRKGKEKGGSEDA